jgi:tetratricopeptide (TPR) repeat protein
MLYNKVLQTNAENDEALCGLGLIALERRRFRLAQDLLQRALALNPQNTEAKTALTRLESAWTYRLLSSLGTQRQGVRDTQRSELELQIEPDELSSYSIRYEKRSDSIPDIGSLVSPANQHLQFGLARKVAGLGNLSAKASYLRGGDSTIQSIRRGLDIGFAAPLSVGGIQIRVGQVWGGPEIARSGLIGYEVATPQVVNGLSFRVLGFFGKNDFGYANQTIVIGSRYAMEEQNFIDVAVSSAVQNSAAERVRANGMSLTYQRSITKRTSLGVIAEWRQPGIRRLELIAALSWL